MNENKKVKNKILLCILDGFAVGDLKNPYNAYAASNATYLKTLIHKYHICDLHTSGVEVGLPNGQFGNSEVGHQMIGSGRVGVQKIDLISRTINTNSTINDLLLKDNNLHLFALYSSGGVHSHMNHVNEILKKCNTINQNKTIFLHLFSDGRDCGVNDFISDVKTLEQIISNKNIKIASISGRYFAMDRDKKMERTHKYFDALFSNIIEKNTPVEYVQNSYEKNTTDEFLEPAMFLECPFTNDDDLLFCNFRADRMRQLVELFYSKNKNNIYTFTDYFAKQDDFNKIKILFPDEAVPSLLSRVYSKNGNNQLKIAESEKYPHVTFFFNGQNETPFPNEDRVIIPSPKIHSYDKQPEMSLPELTKTLIENISINKYDLIVCNIANCDMVGHTGNFEATKQAVDFVNDALEKIHTACIKQDYVLIITSDHGNIDDMYIADTNKPNTTHSSAKVPFLICKEGFKKNHRQDLTLANIAKTIVKIADIHLTEVDMMNDSII